MDRHPGIQYLLMHRLIPKEGLPRSITGVQYLSGIGGKNMSTLIKSRAALILLLLALSACGGGGGGGGTNDDGDTPAANTDWDSLIWNDDNWQ
jgi:hypothetical protein